MAKPQLHTEHESGSLSFFREGKAAGLRTQTLELGCLGSSPGSTTYLTAPCLSFPLCRGDNNTPTTWGGCENSVGYRSLWAYCNALTCWLILLFFNNLPCYRGKAISLRSQTVMGRAGPKDAVPNSVQPQAAPPLPTHPLCLSFPWCIIEPSGQILSMSLELSLGTGWAAQMPAVQRGLFWQSWVDVWHNRSLPLPFREATR